MRSSFVSVEISNLFENLNIVGFRIEIILILRVLCESENFSFLL